jgi:hypothetical protein
MNSCSVTKSTRAFVLDVNGTRYRLDRKSSYDARGMIDGRGDRARRMHLNGEPVYATVTGRVKANGRIRANIIDVHQ